MRGLVLTRQFPNAAEKHRGTFVVQQMMATRDAVRWRVIAPAPYVPQILAGRTRHPVDVGCEDVCGWQVDRPRYVVLPRRLLYSTVGASMAHASRDAFADAVRRHEPEFVHAHELYPSGAAAIALARQFDIPVVVTVHGSDLYTNITRPKWKAAVRDVVASATLTICVGTKLAADTLDALNANPERVRVIHDTYDEQAYRLVERTGRRASDRLRLVSVGRLVPEKGHDVLLESLAALVSEGLGLSLDLVGAGPLEADLRVKATSLGLADRVNFLGSLSGDALCHTLAHADLYVQPSRREGFGLALVEAMATGLPAVATASGGPSEIVTSDVGALVAPGDAGALAQGLREAAARLGEFSSAGIAAQIRARFGNAVVGERLVSAYREVIGGEFDGRG